MFFRFVRLLLPLVSAVVLFPSMAVSADVERGGVLFETCFGCHGSEDYHNVYPTYKVPRLVGQWPEYIVAALQEYKSGARQHPTMKAQATSFSTEDMQDIAAYVATLGELPTSEAVVGTAPEAAATCVACHGAEGRSPAFTFPHLAGQHADYMVHSLKAYKSGERSNPIMAPNVANMSEADMAAVAAFYAQQPGLKTAHKK